jgi:hypothetical protein
MSLHEKVTIWEWKHFAGLIQYRLLNIYPMYSVIFCCDRKATAFWIYIHFSSRFPEDGTPVPKHVAVWYLSWIFMVEPCIFRSTDCLLPPLHTRHILYTARYAAASQQTNEVTLLIFYKFSFSKERSVLPEDVRITETCSS